MVRKNSQLHQRLRDEIWGIKIYSSHEHFCTEQQYLDMHLDFASLVTHYVLAGFQWVCSSGRSQADAEAIDKLKSPDVSEDEKWEIFEPYREMVWNTGCFREVQLVLEGLYGIKDLNRKTYTAVGQCLRENQRPGHYKEIMDKSGIDYAMVDHMATYGENPEYDLKHFGPVYRIDEWRETPFYKKHGITTVDETFDKIAEYMQVLADNGTKAIKVVNPVADNTHFSTKWKKPEIEKAFECILRDKSASRSQIEPFAHAMVSEFVRHAEEYSMCVQIHTGWQMFAAGNPYLLRNLFEAFPEVKFDVFHAGYPFNGELATLARFRPNVYPDLCWVAKESGTLAKRILSEWLEMIPINQILAFGNDTVVIDNCYGYQQIVRQTVLEVLEEKVLSKIFSEDQAILIANKILRDNLKSIINNR